MTLDFQLNEDDYVDAQQTHLRKSLRGLSGILPAIFALMALLGIIGLVFWLIQPSNEMGRQLAPMSGFVVLVITMGFYVRSGLLYRRQFRKIKALQRPMQMAFDNDEIVYTSPTAQAKILWSAFEDWRESKNSFLLYPQPRMFYIVPKRAIQADQIPAFRSILEARIHKSR
jgi:hypothetical protein